MRRAAHPSGCARCGAGAGCAAIKYQSLRQEVSAERSARGRGAAMTFDYEMDDEPAVQVASRPPLRASCSASLWSWGSGEGERERREREARERGERDKRLHTPFALHKHKHWAILGVCDQVGSARVARQRPCFAACPHRGARRCCSSLAPLSAQKLTAQTHQARCSHRSSPHKRTKHVTLVWGVRRC